LDEVSYTGGLKFLVMGGAILGILNTFVKPLMKILSFPLIFMTGGIFTIVINVIILGVTKRLIDVIAYQDVALQISGVGNYLLAGLVLGVVNWLIHLMISNK
jgi:putative membrane protein